MLKYLDSLSGYIKRAQGRREVLQNELDSIIASQRVPKSTAPKSSYINTPGRGSSVGNLSNVPINGEISLQELVKRIAQKESGGNYSALGEITSSGDRAYGKYQIMGNNIPSWTEAVLGHSLTPQQFLHHKKAQDKVAIHMLKGYYKKYGAGGAAASWYAGPSAAAGWEAYKKANYSPAGTRYPSVYEYVRAILNG